jgi:2-isopropylmalate synthase
VAEIANITLDAGMPYVGQDAFAHKAGMHIDAVLKTPTAYEHIAPETIGNDRVILVSEAAGRSAVIEKIKKFDPKIDKDNPVVGEIVKTMKEMEHFGYQFEGAEGSFELLVRKLLGTYHPFFKLHYYKTIGEKPRLDDTLCSFAQLKIEVGGKLEVTAGEGDGPVHALDVALRKALERFYPAVSHIRLIDYKVRVLDSKSATASKVRVLIESADELVSWTTVGVSSDIIEASWLALVDSFEYKLSNC